MIHIVDRARAALKLATPTLCIDDPSAEVIGADRQVATKLIGFTLMVCDGPHSVGDASLDNQVWCHL